MNTTFAQRTSAKKNSHPISHVGPGVKVSAKHERGAVAGMPLFLHDHNPTLRAKLTVSSPDDSYEQEADQVADEVMRMPDLQHIVQRKCAACEKDEQRVPTTSLVPSAHRSVQRQSEAEPQGLFDKNCYRSKFAGVYETRYRIISSGWILIHPGACTQCEQKPIHECCEPGDRQCESSSGESSAGAVQEKPDVQTTPLIQRESGEKGVRSTGNASETSRGLEHWLGQRQGGGSPLPAPVKIVMASRMGYDFSHVRIHTDGEAAQMSRELGAQAFTHGHHVYFGAGKYAPGSTAGTHLLAHELTHVVQQTGGVQTKRTSDQFPIQMKCAACEEEEERVHRSPDDFLPKLTWRDWVFAPPAPKGSSDDRYDTPENRRRAEEKEASERSGDQQPNEWWKPKRPTMPRRPADCPEERWNPFWSTCCAAGTRKDPTSSNCISSDSVRPVRLPPLPPSEKGDFPPPNPDGRYA
jgi:uncharacterized protein DUF4157